MDLAISYVNETAANNDKVEHVPGVAEVVLTDRRREREKERERDRQREREGRKREGNGLVAEVPSHLR